MQVELAELDCAALGSMPADFALIKIYFFIRVLQTGEILEMLDEMTFESLNAHQPAFTDLLRRILAFLQVLFQNSFEIH